MGILQRIGRLAAATVLVTGAALAVATPANASGWEIAGDHNSLEECTAEAEWGIENGWWIRYFCRGPLHGFYLLYVYVP